MKYLQIYITLILFFSAPILFAEGPATNASVTGHVVNTRGEHLPFAAISIKGTTIGTTSDESGYFRLINLPEGRFIIEVQYLGYQAESRDICIIRGEIVELNFQLSEDLLGLREVIVTGDRNESNRMESSIIVNTLNAKLFNTTQSVTLSEGLNFCTGLRTENDCQNCGFTQLRMNGMEGPYSQILINNRPIYSGLAGVYGLELIPANMIERVEVVRGGGSVLYGSNAIAGTVNLILKDPIYNSYEFSLNGGLTGVGSGYDEPAKDISVNLNGSITSADNKTGMSLYGYYRDRGPFDANNDGFSELSSIRNTTVGSRLFHRFGNRSRITADFFSLNEKRRGGDKFEELPHMSGITEAVEHNILNGALTFEAFIRSFDRLSVYVSGQSVFRNSYYGANASLSDYGKTRNNTYNIGAQYNASFGKSEMVAGIEQITDHLQDKKQGYYDLDGATINHNDSSVFIPVVETRVISDQSMNTTGLFLQYERDFGKLKVSAGARYDHYRIQNHHDDRSDKQGNVISPRVSLKYDILESLQIRASYSQGYRAPQIFDEDLHTETSGARQVIHVNDPGLTVEKSHSVMASLDFNKQFNGLNLGFMAEGFYTLLRNAFSQEISEPDENNIVYYTRVNAEDGAVVSGINMEMTLTPSSGFFLKGGFTLQNSRYEELQEFDERRFLRTPGDYGYVMLDWQVFRNAGLSFNGTYTGKMLVPYFGTEAANPEEGELRESDRFFDASVKIRYNIKLNGAKMQLFAGVKNIFNAYQGDFDRGINRDPGYIYGPAAPRTVYFGIKVGNMLQ
jgi:outer membrane receptor for ferrienterochelin and colicins